MLYTYGFSNATGSGPQTTEVYMVSDVLDISIEENLIDVGVVTPPVVEVEVIEESLEVEVDGHSI